MSGAVTVCFAHVGVPKVALSLMEPPGMGPSRQAMVALYEVPGFSMLPPLLISWRPAVPVKERCIWPLLPPPELLIRWSEQLVAPRGTVYVMRAETGPVAVATSILGRVV